MSAFFVNKEPIDDVVLAFIKDTKKPVDADKLGRSLWAMNAEAVRQRYPSIEGTAEERHYLKEAEEYRFSMPSVSHAQLAKSCRCLYYQCSEGNIGEGNADWDPLYHTLGHLCEKLGYPIGYDFEAVWDRAG